MLPSPCNLICSIDPKTGYCFGCGRTREELAEWMTASDARQAEILAALPARLAEIERRPRRETQRRRMARLRNDGAQ